MSRKKKNQEPQDEHEVFDEQDSQDEQPVLDAQEPQDEQSTRGKQLTHTAKQLAALARTAKHAIANGADPEEALDPVFAAHKKYLKEVAAGASASAKDVKFVKTHLQHLQSI